MVDSDDSLPENTVRGEWWEIELLGTDEDRYANLRLNAPADLNTGVLFRNHFGEPGSQDYFETDIEWNTPPGENGDVSFEYLLGGDTPADAEVFRELADAATQVAEYLESEDEE